MNVGTNGKREITNFVLLLLHNVKKFEYNMHDFHQKIAWSGSRSAYTTCKPKKHKEASVYYNRSALTPEQTK